MTGYLMHLIAIFVKTMPVLSAGFQIETELSIHAVDKRWRILDVPIDYRDRPEGSDSKLFNIQRWRKKYLMAIASLFKDYKPMAFFWMARTYLSGARACRWHPCYRRIYSHAPSRALPNRTACSSASNLRRAITNDRTCARHSSQKQPQAMGNPSLPSLRPKIIYKQYIIPK